MRKWPRGNLIVDAVDLLKLSCIMSLPHLIGTKLERLTIKLLVETHNHWTHQKQRLGSQRLVDSAPGLSRASNSLDEVR